MASPLSIIAGHNKAVSFVRFLGSNRLVTASTDDTLRMWDIDAAVAGNHHQCGLVNTFSGML